MLMELLEIITFKRVMLQFQEVSFISLARYRQLSQRILEDHDKNPPPPFPRSQVLLPSQKR